VYHRQHGGEEGCSAATCSAGFTVVKGHWDAVDVKRMPRRSAADVKRRPRWKAAVYRSQRDD